MDCIDLWHCTNVFIIIIIFFKQINANQHKSELKYLLNGLNVLTHILLSEVLNDICELYVR